MEPDIETVSTVSLPFIAGQIVPTVKGNQMKHRSELMGMCPPALWRQDHVLRYRKIGKSLKLQTENQC